jgi:hypothetical protein
MPIAIQFTTTSQLFLDTANAKKRSQTWKMNASRLRIKLSGNETIVVVPSSGPQDREINISIGMLARCGITGKDPKEDITPISLLSPPCMKAERFSGAAHAGHSSSLGLVSEIDKLIVVDDDNTISHSYDDSKYLIVTDDMDDGVVSHENPSD